MRTAYGDQVPLFNKACSDLGKRVQPMEAVAGEGTQKGTDFRDFSLRIEVGR